MWSLHLCRAGGQKTQCYAYAGQEATEPDREQGTGSNWERSTSRLYIINLLFNLYAEYINQCARLDEAQPGIKIAGRNINNLRYEHDTTLIE